MNDDTVRNWLTVKQAAAYIAVNQQYIYDAISAGELKHSRLAGKRTIRLRREWLDDWVEQHSV